LQGATGEATIDKSKSAVHAFGSVADGLRLIPAEAGYARYLDLGNDTELTNATNSYTWLKGRCRRARSSTQTRG